MCRRWMVLAAVACSIGIVIASAVPALGHPGAYELQWLNAGTGATHPWVTAKAIDIARSRGAGWVDGIAVSRSSYPDQVFHDQIDHNANWWGSYPSYYNDSWGSRFGNPHGKVQQYYDLTVAALRRGDRIEASKNLGYLSHYLGDINHPLYTEESKLEDYDLHHSLNLKSADTNFSGYIADDGFQYYGGQASPSALVVANATASHEYYWELARTYDDRGFNTHVRDILGLNLNRGINSLADLIQSAQFDADQLTPVIDSISPSMITTGVPVTFAGHGVDSNGHAIVGANWRSSKDGQLSVASSFTTSALTMGIHNIYFKVACSGPKWSAETFRSIVVGARNTKPRAVYRFYNLHNGVHFYTASEQERQTVQTTMASMYKLEGVGYALDTSSTVNNAPLHRFFDKTRGVHFLTADETEKATLQNTMGHIYSYDGIVARVSKTNALGNGTIFRFYNLKTGMHFYTASLAEKAYVISNLAGTYKYEGVAYYYDPPW